MTVPYGPTITVAAFEVVNADRHLELPHSDPQHGNTGESYTENVVVKIRWKRPEHRILILCPNRGVPETVSLWLESQVFP